MEDFTIEIQPKLPARLARLADLTSDLRYSWDRGTRTLFSRLSRTLWDAVGHNPKVFLRRIEQHRLEQAADDPVYLDAYDRVLSRYKTYLAAPARRAGPMLHATDLVAYFSAEFGFHESIQIYSGGLGILAGDHCKAASDFGLPFVGVGLLYRQGYFNQTFDAEGNQVANYYETDFRDLPFVPAVDAKGDELRVRVPIEGRNVAVRVWKAKAGRINLYFLDSDLPENDPDDRAITRQLYGGDQNTRIKQEIVLGVGGVRALRAVGLSPTVWHVNEGHAALLIVERCRELVAAGRDFATALEACAAATVFTTHTPVRAGHDVFLPEMVDRYFRALYEGLGLTSDAFRALGTKADDPGFNLTALAVRGSRHHNGVSRIHGGVSSRLLAPLWPQIPPEENPVTYVTNGVHVATFLAREWADVFDAAFGGEWRTHLSSAEFWTRVDSIPDHLFWSVRQTLKSRMLEQVRSRLTVQLERNGCSDGEIERTLRHLDPRDPNILTVGFARRFATYKRATLLLQDRERLARFVSDPERPVVFVFAGKAHPADAPAQEMISELFTLTRDPAFDGRILIVEGYDMSLARKMVSGVDVWLNTPRFPLEASGTSGQKAGMNGAINLSVLDGWWGEGFDGANGWGIPPFPVEAAVDRRDREEAANLYDILEQEVMPLYYERRGHGFPKAWVEKSKRSMRTILPRFSAARMVAEYSNSFYKRASAHGRALHTERFAGAKKLAAWKARVRAAWSGVSLRLLSQPQPVVKFGSDARIEVAAKLNGLSAQDVRVECLLDDHAYQFADAGPLGSDERRMTLDLRPESCGLVTYRIRMYPFHELLAHPHEVGLMIWLS